MDDFQLGNYFYWGDPENVVVLTTKMGDIILVHSPEKIEIPYDSEQYVPHDSTKLIKQHELVPIPLSETWITEFCVCFTGKEEDGSWKIVVENESRGNQNHLFVKKDDQGEYLAWDGKGRFARQRIKTVHEMQNFITLICSEYQTGG